MLSRTGARGAQTAAALAVSLAAGLLHAGCKGDGGSGKARLPSPPRVVGIVLDYADERVDQVPVAVLGAGISGETRIDGLAALGDVPTGNRVLVVGDSVDTPTLLVPYTQADPSTFLDRPIYLPALESGVSASLAASLAAPATVSGDNMPGVALDLAGGTTLSGFGGELTVVGVSPSRLPRPVDGALATPRAAYLVEPHGMTISPAAALTVPRLDTVNAAFDVYKVDTTSGEWVVSETNVATGADDHTLSVDEGTLYAVVAQVGTGTVTVTGRVVVGTTPVEGYVASCWNLSSAPTGSDGTFQIDDVPDLSAFPVRVQPAEPGLAHAPEVVTVVSETPSLSADVAVAARIPDEIQPKVKSVSPRDDARNVDRNTLVTVTFTEPVDTRNRTPFRLLGPSGQVAGSIAYQNGFTAQFRPTESLDPTTSYNVLVDSDLTDLAGNELKGEVNTRFTTRSGALTPPPTDTLAFGLDPLVASRGDAIEIDGRNYTGGTDVTFGSTLGTVLFESSSLVEAQVPDFEPAGNVTVSLSSGGTGIGSLQPLVLDLRALVTTLYEDTGRTTPVVFVDRAAPPTVLFVDGANVGATSVTVDGVAFSATDFVEVVASTNVATGRQVALTTPASNTLLTGPVVLRGSNGRPGRTYRFLHVRD
jgi:hypothetical protein